MIDAVRALTGGQSSQGRQREAAIAMRQPTLVCGWIILVLLALVSAQAGTISVLPVGNQGFDVLASGVLVAPIRLAGNGAIVADQVTSNATGLQFFALHASDSLAVTFATNAFVSVTLPAPGDTNLGIAQ